MKKFIKTMNVVGFGVLLVALSACNTASGQKAVALSQGGVRYWCVNNTPMMRSAVRETANTCDGAVYSLCPGDDVPLLVKDVLAHAQRCGYPIDADAFAK